MTLIIGFTCHEGIALVSDTKISNMETQEFEYESKILAPLTKASFIVGAAGYSHLFREFNRKLPDLTDEHVQEVNLKNMKALQESGIPQEDVINRIYPKDQESQKSQELKENTKPEVSKENQNNFQIPLPHIYTAENFIDDCKYLIKKVSSQVEDDPQAIEVLIGLHRRTDDHPSIHFIDSGGNEQEIDKYYAIGSGSPHVRLFFERLYDYNKSIAELCTDAFRSIVYASHIALDRSVGYRKENPIDVYAVLPNGAAGPVNFKNSLQVINDLENETKGSFEVLIKNSHVKILEWSE